LASVLPLLSGIATYGLSAWIAAATGDACGGRYLPGTRVGTGVAFLALVALPPIVVMYRAIVTRRSWPVGIGLVFAAGALTAVAVAFAALMWAGGHQCFE